MSDMTDQTQEAQARAAFAKHERENNGVSENAILAMLETKADLTEGQTTIRNSLDWLKANKTDSPQSEVRDAHMQRLPAHGVGKEL